MKHVAAVVLCVAVAWSARAQTSDELANLSVDDLMKVEVTSVARRGQRLSETPAATFVISQEDIRRSGATSIPELLRMVPGFDVAQIDNNTWGVSARGFNGRWSNKLLVLVDGRSVYSPIFAGVRWDVQNVPLEDIDHIEVTRGPGGTLWGANAMNGIVNIITKHPIDTQGTVASVSHGSNAGPTAGVRYGASIGQSGYIRAGLNAFRVPATVRIPGARGGNDDWSTLRGGFRAEWTRGSGVINLQGDAYSGRSGETIDQPSSTDPWGTVRTDPNAFNGRNLLFRWSETESPRSETTLQAYYDEAERTRSMMNDRSQTLDLDIGQHLTLGGHDATFGVEARSLRYSTSSESGTMHMTPADGAADLLSAFVQDEIRMSAKLTVTLGWKVIAIRNDGQLRRASQPSIRALWTIRPNEALWGAVTQAVRLPSEYERHSYKSIDAFPGRNGQPVTVAMIGDDDLVNERMRSYEIGYRGVLTSLVSIDLTAYRAVFKDLVNTAADPPSMLDGQPVLPVVFHNGMSGSSQGVEALVTLRPARRWDLTAGYTFFGLRLNDYGDGISSDDLAMADVPRHQYSLRSYFTVSPRVELDASAYYVGGVASQNVPRFVRTDFRAAWQMTPALELSVTGKNLTGHRHIEFNGVNEAAAVTPVSRTMVGMLTWRR